MKYFAKFFCKSLIPFKSNIVILFALSFLSAFMYFFVQISIDGNMFLLLKKPVLSGVDKEFLISLNSNCVLAFSFLLILSLITGFVYLMFYKKYCSFKKKEYGCFMANGFLVNQMIGIVFVISVIFMGLAYFLGLFFGWLGSDIMIKLYNKVYDIKHLAKGLNMINALIALACTLMPSILVIPIMKKMTNNDIAILLKKDNLKAFFPFGKLSKFLLGKSSFSLRLAFRRPFLIFMSLTCVGIFTVLVIMSFSLNLSSRYVFENLSSGRSYQYDLSYKTPQTQQTKSNDYTYYYSEHIYINCNDQKISGVIMGIEENNYLLSLTNLKNKKIKNFPKNNVVISQALANLYDISLGDDILITLGDKIYSLRVFDILKNGDNFAIYTSKNTVTDLLNLPNTKFNGIYAKNLKEIPMLSLATIHSMDERINQLEANNVSNRISAIICQVLAFIIGCLLLYLTILLKFQEDMANVFILDMMGYTSGEINKMFISLYRPILNVGFFLLLIPSITICKAIHKSLSLATNDYIPFRSNVMVIVIAFVMLNLIYSLIKLLFRHKIKAIQENEATKSFIV